MSEETYYGFKLTGLSRCFLAVDYQSLKRSIEVSKADKSMALVIIDNALMQLLSKNEIADLEASEAPLFFAFDTTYSKEYNKDLDKLINRLGISMNGA